MNIFLQKYILSEKKISLLLSEEFYEDYRLSRPAVSAAGYPDPQADAGRTRQRIGGPG